MSLPAYTPLPNYPPGEVPTTPRPPARSASADPWRGMKAKVFSPPIIATMLRCAQWLMGIGLPVVILLAILQVAGFFSLLGYLVLVVCIICGGCFGVRALFIILGPECAPFLLFTVFVVTGIATLISLSGPSIIDNSYHLRSARVSSYRFHPAWIALIDATIIALAILGRAFYLRDRLAENDGEAQQTHIPSPDTEAILHASRTGDRTSTEHYASPLPETSKV